MSKKDIEKAVEELAAPIIDEEGFELVDLEYTKMGQDWLLRLYIDKPQGVSIDDCQIISERLGQILDLKDPIPNSYILEVSSAGLDRPLKKDGDFKRFTGHKVDLKLYKPLNGSKVHTGELMGLFEDIVKIKTDKGVLSFKRNDIAIVKLFVDF